MIPNIVKGSGVSGAVRYVLGEGRDKDTKRAIELAPGQASRVAWIGGTGFGFTVDNAERAELARKVMEFGAANQTSRTRKADNDCLHLSLSWAKGETPGRAEMLEAAHSALDALGMGGARALFVSHNDTDHTHLHIVASRIDPETGRAYRDSYDKFQINRWAHRWELEHGGIRCEKRATAQQLAETWTAEPGKALAAITKDRATFTTQDLSFAVGRVVPYDEQRDDLMARIMALPDVVALSERAGGPVTRYTTQAVLKSEREVLAAAEQLADDQSHAVSRDKLVAVMERQKFATIREEQYEALLHATGAGGFAAIAGEAGTGKSYTMAAIREVYEASGCRVVGLSPTNKIIQDMARDGFREVQTVAGARNDIRRDACTCDSRTVLMVDEAGMMGTADMATVTQQAAEAGAKLILVGDDKQLASIERGGMFGALCEQHGAAELSEVTRAKDSEQRRAFNLMHRGEFREALGIFDQQGAVNWTKTQGAAMDALLGRVAQDMRAEPDKARFIFAYTNADVDQINAGVRAIRRERGELGEDHQLRTSRGVETFAQGDRIQFTASAYRKDMREAGIANGVAGTVAEIDGLRVTVALDVAQGAKPRFVSFTVGENAKAGQFDGFRHGYAGTIYKGQGATLDQTYLYHSQHWRQASSYVALSRHRETTALFVATDTAADLNELARQMNRPDERRAASQFHMVAQPERAAGQEITGGTTPANASTFAQAARAATGRPDAAEGATAQPEADTGPTPAEQQRRPVTRRYGELDDAHRATAAAERAAAAQRIAARVGKIADPARQADALRRAHEREAEQAKPDAGKVLTGLEAFEADLRKADEAAPKQADTPEAGRSRDRGHRTR
jgi:hypothetical protein